MAFFIGKDSSCACARTVCDHSCATYSTRISTAKRSTPSPEPQKEIKVVNGKVYYDIGTGSIMTVPFEENKMNDNVKHPSHYTNGGIECIDAIRASLGLSEFADYCKGNVIKYLWRYRLKNGVEDLEKAAVYLKWMTEAERELANDNRG